MNNTKPCLDDLESIGRIKLLLISPCDNADKNSELGFVTDEESMALYSVYKLLSKLILEILLFRFRLKLVSSS